MIYEWKPRFPNEKADAQVVGTFVEQLRVENSGVLTPEVVVEAAREEGSPIHDLFEWNDTFAAQRYRLEQAKDVIRALVVRVESRPQLPIRAFVSVVQEGSEERSYTSTVVAMQSPVLRQQVIEAALGEITAWRKRYHDLQEFSRLFEEIDQLEL